MKLDILGLLRKSAHPWPCDQSITVPAMYSFPGFKHSCQSDELISRVQAIAQIKQMIMEFGTKQLVRILVRQANANLQILPSLEGEAYILFLYRQYH